MTHITRQLAAVTATLPQGVRLVAVSKFHPVEALQEAYDAGQRIFGESRVQELQLKHEALPADIEWHFIGHLQTNKVRYIIPYVALIHSVDSLRLLQEIETQAARVGRVVDVLIEVHVAQEETKYGFSPEACRELLDNLEATTYPHVRICGIMGMASNTDDEERIATDFATLQNLFDSLRAGSMRGVGHFTELSMGMSHDYPIAIDHGTTLVRVGTTIFGERQY